ncbi:MAG: sulfite oxidase [Desulfobacterales bacterium]|jgi:DMSO/TMAO reductase YedYZ molybdopterin-dependent catalytic subunit
MKKKMRVMTEKPLNAETPIESLRTWTTDNRVFFKRNQGQIMQRPVRLSAWKLIIEGLVKRVLKLSIADIRNMPKVEVANTLECSGNSRSLLKEKAFGNPWTIGGVGNAIWGGIWLKDLLKMVDLKRNAKHVSFEGLDKPLGSAGIRFIRSIPLEKAISSTILAYQMNGEPLPLKHGYPLRAVALGWTGANCVKWLHKITVLDRPYEGFFMDKVYRVFQKGEDPRSGEVVEDIMVKSIITEPIDGESLSSGTVAIRGTAYAGEAGIKKVEVTVNEGQTWNAAKLIGIEETYAWRHWEYLWDAQKPGDHTIMSRATDQRGKRQPDKADWNVLGYGNNGIQEHAIRLNIV